MTTTIHGENATSIAAILQYILMPDHPFHTEAMAQAAAFIKAEKDAENGRGRKMMQEQMKYITADEWSRIVD